MLYHTETIPHNASHGVLSNLDVIGTSCNALSLVARRSARGADTVSDCLVAAGTRRVPPTAILLDTDSARVLSY